MGKSHHTDDDSVSTHSRLKAAGRLLGKLFLLLSSFNTQPPEGGWTIRDFI